MVPGYICDKVLVLEGGRLTCSRHSHHAGRPDNGQRCQPIDHPWLVDTAKVSRARLCASASTGTPIKPHYAMTALRQMNCFHDQHIWARKTLDRPLQGAVRAPIQATDVSLVLAGQESRVNLLHAGGLRRRSITPIIQLQRCYDNNGR